MIAKREYFAQRKGDVPPAACSDAEWSRTAQRGACLDMGYVGSEGGGRCCGGGLVG